MKTARVWVWVDDGAPCDDWTATLHMTLCNALGRLAGATYPLAQHLITRADRDRPVALIREGGSDDSTNG